MTNVRLYGTAPFRHVLVHGGPGAPGQMAPVAEELSRYGGMIEPFQAAGSIEGQLQELRGQVERNAEPPVTLAGHSWGAWLGFLFAARFPPLVGKLILIGSGPFTDEYAASTGETRRSRLTQDEARLAAELEVLLAEPGTGGSSDFFIRYGALMAKTDTLDPIRGEPDEIRLQPEVYRSVWAEAASMRTSGALLDAGREIRCPVTAIHGDYDPHPAEGVRVPLAGVINDFKFILLNFCGHYPWNEAGARELFYRVLIEEMGLSRLQE